MGRRGTIRLAGAVGLIALAGIAGGLSAAALLQNRTAVPAPADPAALVTAQAEVSTAAPRVTKSAAAPSVTPTAAPSPSATKALKTVVVIGDSFSLGDEDELWIGTAGSELGWGEVTNLSSPGRGYVRTPRSCDLSVCDNFGGSISLIAESEPDVVVTFGGIADRYSDLSAPATEYFAALREALPDAELVALSPITGDSTVSTRFEEQAAVIKAAVEDVDGHFVDLGQPGVGDGDQLKRSTQREIGDLVVAALKGEG